FTEGKEEGDFGALIRAGARMARASHAALSLALLATPAMARIGTDILVPRDAFGELQKLAGKNPDVDNNPDIEITDASLAIEHDQVARAPEGSLKFARSTPKSAVPKDDPPA